MEMKPEYIAAIIVVAMVGYFLLGKRKIPEQKTFRCRKSEALLLAAYPQR